tara:strand:+ start:66 stop:281 length:216 start_codon:yes stop_codon:yes gene_type:complete
MRMDSYTKKEMTQDFKDIKEHIREENLEGADITVLIEDVFNHYEVANRCNFKNSKGHYSDLLSRLVKTYGH